jgi:glutathione S-transferase
VKQDALQAESEGFDGHGPSSELDFHVTFPRHLKDVYPEERKIKENDKKIHDMLDVYDEYEILSKNAYLAGDGFTLAGSLPYS